MVHTVGHVMRNGRTILLLGATLLAGCAGGDDGAARTTSALPSTGVPAPTSRPAPSPTSPAAFTNPNGTCPTTPGSSRADFDGLDGEFATYLFTVDVATRTVTFDVIQYLVGEDARREHVKQNPSEPGGPPNDYTIANALVHIDSAKVSADAEVWTLTDRIEHRMSTLDRLQADSRPSRRPALGLYWLTFQGGTVTRLCQQFTP